MQPEFVPIHPLPAQPLLRATAITKSFAAVRALRNVNFDLRTGEVHALVGENGAGKSTFTKIATGVLSPDSGDLEIDEERIITFTPDHARSRGITAIYQQPSLFPHLTVAENIALVLEQGSSTWTVDWRNRERKAKVLIDQLGASISPRRLAGSLSMAEQQIIEIAKAIGSRSKIVFMDEPTALLTDREVDNLFRIVRQLRSEQVGVVYISHRLEELQQISDRISVLRDGETIGTCKASEISRKELIGMMVGRDIASIFPKRDVVIREEVLRVENLNNPQRGLKNISFDVRAGEILGFAGLVGAGRTELAETIFGLSPSDDGNIHLDGKHCHFQSPRQAIDFGVGYLPEDRRRHGLILDMPISSNISMADPYRVAAAGLIDSTKEATLAKDFVDRLRIKASSIHTQGLCLSGGNQQKVALSRWLATKPRLMILDEPTQGVDVGSKAEIHEIISTMAENGVAIILISSELPEILGMCDRVAVFHNGSIAAILPRKEATQEKIMTLAFGHSLQPGSPA